MPVAATTLGWGFLVAGLVVPAFLRKPLRYPDRAGSKWFAVVVVGCAVYLLTLGSMYVVSSPSIRGGLLSLRFFSVSVICSGWFLLTAAVTTRRWPSDRLLAAFAVYLAIGAIVLATNHVTGFAFETASLDGEFPEPSSGPWHTFQVAVNVAILGAATALAAVVALRSSGLRQIQSGAIALSPLLPTTANVASFLGVVPVGPDLTPLGLFGSAFVMSWALYRAEFLSLVPVGRQTAVEEMHDAVVTLDRRQRVVDCNAAAWARFDADEDYFGTPLASFLTGVPDDAVAAIAAGETPQFRLQGEDRDRVLDCAAAPVGPGAAPQRGRVIVFRDITERAATERALLERRESLEAYATVVSEDIQAPLDVARDRAERARETGDVSHLEDVLRAADRIDRRSRTLLQESQEQRPTDHTE